MIDEAEIQCPCCGEFIWLEIDGSLPRQEYVEDCQVCCRPLVVRVETHADGSVAVTARSEND
jgi:hypothetical protein